MKSILVGLTLCTVFLFTFSVQPQFVSAQGSDGLVPKACQDDVRQCNYCAFIQLVNNVINFLFEVLIVVAVIMMVYAGLKLATSGGDVNAMTSAKSMITNVLIGFVIVLAAWLIVDTIFKVLVGDENTQYGVWNEFDSDECGGVLAEPLRNSSDSN